jgi:hypothetical protein
MAAIRNHVKESKSKMAETGINHLLKIQDGGDKDQVKRSKSKMVETGINHLLKI